MPIYKASNFKLFHGDCIKVMSDLHSPVDMIFADPPYKLSNGGFTCQSGKKVSVNKGKWDKSKGLAEDHKFNLQWLNMCKEVMNPNATIWISGTYHIIYSIGFALHELGFKILNEIAWFKPNASPNLSCRYFTASHETLIWAARDKNSKHIFNYQEMKKMNGGRQMRSVWEIPSPSKKEKIYGKHPTQKPIALLERIILSSTNPEQIVLDPFTGSGTTGEAAIKFDRKFIGIEKEKEYIDLTFRRLKAVSAIRTIPSRVDNDCNKLVSIGSLFESQEQYYPSRSEISQSFC
ncbi:MAG: site-specific DNA-methyltransferase [Firmicutes bacterium HGW-Firmicutes-14]|nr:MAG: site-specific DNA-methyltransferase [Firmicutes bacterium HGW-Firmicutes-14]